MVYQSRGNLNSVGYVNSDYAGCKNMCQSIKGNIFIVAEGPVSWESKWQEIVTLSTIKAEYVAFTRATTQVLWLTKFFNEISLPIKSPIEIRVDNNRSISNSINDKNHRHTKYINIKYHFVKEHTAQGEVLFKYILLSDNLTDIFTKLLPCNTIQKLTMYLKYDNSLTTIVQGEYWSEPISWWCLFLSYLYYDPISI